MADVTVDRVQIEVEATAKDVNKVFNSLAQRLSTLKKSMTGFDTSQLTNMTNALNKLSTSIDNLASKAKNTNVAPKVDTSGISKAEEKINSGVQNIRESLAGLQSYANAAMNGDSSALTSFDRRVTSIQSSIDTLKEKLEASKDALSIEVPTEEFTKLDNQITTARDKFDELIAKEKEFSNSGKTNTAEYAPLQTDIAAARDALNALVAKQGEMITNGSAFTSPYKEYKATLEQLQGTLDSLKNKVHSTVSQMNVAPKVNTSTAQTNLSALKTAALSAASAISKISASSVVSGIRNLSSSFTRLGSNIVNLKSKLSSLNGMFNKGFASVLKYAFGIRSTYVLIRRLRQAIKDSFTELQQSGAYYETTKANIDALKSSLSILKYQFGAAFEPIFNTIAPALQTFINYLIAAMNTLSAFIAKLTGKSTYSKAVKATADIAGNAGSAANSAKEMAKQLQGFDELNNLSGESGGGSGGSGGSSGDSSGVTYVSESVENALGSFSNDLINKIKEGDWEGLGNTIRDKLMEMMDNIPWSKIQEKASKFGTGLADFLNGLFETNEDGSNVFTSVGKTAAEALNTAFDFLKSFGEEFDWDSFGDSLGRGITTFFETFEWDEAGEACNTWITGILDAGIALLKSTDWNEIGTSFAEFLNGFDFSEIWSKVTTFCSKLITSIGQVITGFKTNASEKTKLTTAIGGLLGVLAISKSIPLTLTFAAALAGIWIGTKYYEITSGNKVDQSFTEEIGDILEGLFGETKVKINLAGAISFVYDELTGQNNEDETGAVKAIKKALAFAITTMTGMRFVIDIAKIISFKSQNEGKDWETFKSDFWAGVKKAIQTIMINGTPFSIPVNLYKILNFVADKLEGTSLGDAISKVKSKFKEEWDKIWGNTNYSKTGANGMPSAVAETLDSNNTTLESLGKNIWEGIKNGFVKVIDGWWQPVKDMWDNLVSDIKEIFGISSPAKTMEPYGEYIFDGIVKGFKAKFNTFKTAIKTLWTKIKSWLKTYITDKISGVFNGIKTITITVNGIIGSGFETIKDAWEKIKDKKATLTATVKETTTGALNKVKEVWESSKRKAVTIAVSFVKDFGKGINNVVDYVKSFGGTALDVAIKLKENFGSGIKSVADWLKSLKGGTDIEAKVTLKSVFSDGAKSITDWITKQGSTDVNATVELEKSKKWNDAGGTIAEWVTKNGGSAVVTQAIGLTQSSTWNSVGGTVAGWVTKYGGSGVVSQAIGLVKSKKWTDAGGTIAKWVNSNGGSSTVTSSVDLTQSSSWLKYGKTLSAWITGGKSVSVSATVNLVSGWSGTIAQWLIKMFGGAKANDNGTFTVGPFTAQRRGGSFVGSSWHSIPQFAKGGLPNHGTLFAAGEKGAEVVGNIGHRTEVLNRSQLAATMSYSITKGLAQFRNLKFDPQMATNNNIDSVGYNYASYMSDAIIEQNKLMAEQNELLREQNRLIAEKDVSISSKDVFSATRKEATNYFNRTGNSPFLF